MDIEIRLDSETDNTNSLLEDIKNLQLPSRPMTIEEESSEPVILMNTKKKEKKKEKKSKKSTLDTFGIDMDLSDYSTVDSDERDLVAQDLEDIMTKKKKSKGDDNDDIIKTQKKGYKKLKDSTNIYKKEFAEEITLLYDLLDETAKFGRSLEKDLSAMRSTKVRGASKYAIDTSEAILTSKQTKLNIIKEITGIKKTIADLAQKADKNNKNDEESANKNERIASSFFKNILAHGRNEFIDSIGISDSYDETPMEDKEYEGYSDKEERDYGKRLEERLDGIVNPYRSDDGNKYIQFEKRKVEVEVHKCVDTGEWEFVAIDKDGEEVEGFPVPTKKDAGRMRFSDDGTYCTDAYGRMYRLVQYYLDDEEEEE